MRLRKPLSHELELSSVHDRSGLPRCRSLHGNIGLCLGSWFTGQTAGLTGVGQWINALVDPSSPDHASREMSCSSCNLQKTQHNFPMEHTLGHANPSFRVRSMHISRC